ncbi:hypothetical protein CLOLEP_01577 [[Clostridium] leptum DSM 753]|uniref:Uncharacterized protein n=1 Tax=[Clostridium] leptum DSM 753 TaxID=428125 RepID=A7VSN6_9FIRM|nr:hypothetical protein CLOLEP_01577 [[Clostridium] leptum DSM 753]PEQ24475.1 hypothetical protein CH238_07870 [[Clostridium] leptum DSM 753]
MSAYVERRGDLKCGFCLPAGRLAPPAALPMLPLRFRGGDRCHAGKADRKKCFPGLLPEKQKQ